MSARELNKDFKDVGSLRDDLSIIDVERAHDGKMYLYGVDGDIGQTIFFNGINNAGYSPEAFVRMYGIISQTLSRIKDNDITLSFAIKKTRDVKVSEIDLKALPIHGVKRYEFLKEMIHNGDCYDLKFFIGVNCYPQSKDKDLNRLQKIKAAFEDFSSMIKGTEDKDTVDKRYRGIAAREQKVKSAVLEITSMLKSIGGDYEIPETKERYLQLIKEFYHYGINKGNNEIQLDNRDEDGISKALENIEVRDSLNSFDINEYVGRTYQMNSVNDSSVCHPNNIAEILSYPGEYVFNTSFRMLSESEAEKIFNFAVIAAKLRDGKNRLTGMKDPRLSEQERRIYKNFLRWGQSQGAVEYSATMTILKPRHEIEKEMQATKRTFNEYMHEQDRILANSHFSNFSSSLWKTEKKSHWYVFSDLFPGSSSLLRKRRIVSVEFPENIPYFLPLCATKRDDLTHYGINHFLTEDGTILPFDFFDKTLASWTMLVSGDMGTGKSVFLNTLVSMSNVYRMISGKKPIVRIIEFGGTAGSFYKLCKQEEGTVLKFNGAKLPEINIFEITPEVARPKRKKRQELCDLIMKTFDAYKDADEIRVISKINNYYKILSDEELELTDSLREKKFIEVFFDDRITEEGFDEKIKILEEFKLSVGNCAPQSEHLDRILYYISIFISEDHEEPEAYKIIIPKSDIIELIEMTYDEIDDGFPCLSDFYKTADTLYPKDEQPAELTTVLARLKNWTVMGTHSMFDCKKTGVDLSNDLIIFDIFGLDKNPQLQAIYFPLILDLIEKDMFTHRDRQRLFLADEVWSALKSRAVQELFAKFMRTSRKYKFGFILASQSPLDFFNCGPDLGNLLVQRATMFTFCGVTNIDEAREAAQRFNLIRQNPGAVDTILRMGVADTNIKGIRKVSKAMMVSVMRGDKMRTNVVQNVLSPYEFHLKNSNDEENTIYEFYEKHRNMKIPDIIELVLNKGYMGDEELVRFIKSKGKLEALELVLNGKL